MKKYIYAIMFLSFTGAIISLALTYQHFNPNANLSFLSCGSGPGNPCTLVSQSDYGSIFGVPIAALGLFFYLTILFFILVADYAGDKYYSASAVVLYPLAILGVAADIALAAILIFVVKTFCHLCVITYIINILMVVAFFFWLRNIKKSQDMGFFAILKDFFTGTGLKKKEEQEELLSNKRAALACFMLFSMMLIFTIILVSMNMSRNAGMGRAHMKQAQEPTGDQIQNFLKLFYEKETEEIDLHNSSLVLGNPEAKVTITAFTDFLCSACYQFYKVEKVILEEFGDQVNIAYYSYPLDPNCNKDIEKVRYKNSCIASQAMLAASKGGFFEEYLETHFSVYEQIKKDYSLFAAGNNFNSVKFPDGVTPITSVRFGQLMISGDTKALLANDISAAIELGISATPTIFIAGRRMEGFPPQEALIALLKNELKKANQKK
ncbi:MAG: thioredoxin domain-containing protein [bacterium]|nr:thioredoxin domain-containing protein [bacterium]